MIELAIAAAMLAAPDQAAKAGVALPPNGRWLLQAEDTLCLLSRDYGTGPDKLTVGFQPLFGEGGQIHILSKADGKRASGGMAKVRFYPGTTKVEGRYYSSLLPNGQRMTRVSFSKDDFEALRNSEEVAFDAPPLSARIRLGLLAKAMTTYDSCEDDLMQSWGVDPKAVTPDRAARVKGNPAALFGSDAYPYEAFNKGYGGRVLAVLKVNADGTVGACHVASGAGNALNEATCRQASKVRFHPATDANDQPIPSVHVFPVRWTLDG